LVAFAAGRAGAAGIPSKGALTYAGTLQDSTGAPLEGPQYIAIQLWDSATETGAAHRVCDTGDPALTPLQNGRFSLSLPDACTVAVGQNPNLFVDALVGPTSAAAASLGGRSKLGAVPFAVEAANAAQLGDKSPSEYQLRVAGSCAAGKSASAVRDDGALDCAGPITAWASFTPVAVVNSSGYPAVTGIDATKTKGAWRRVGESIEVQISMQFLTAVPDNSLLMWQLPNGLKPVPEFADSLGGTAEAWNGTTATACFPQSIADAAAIVLDCQGASTLRRSDVGPAGSGKQYAVGIRYSVPVVGWTLVSP